MKASSPHSTAPRITRREIAEWRDRHGATIANEAAATYGGAGSIAAVEKELREVTLELHRAYGTPNLGNLKDPTDEFAYIVLSRKTPEGAYQAGFSSLKEVGSWDKISELSENEIARIIHGGGLEASKARTLRIGLNEIREVFGTADLSLAGGLDDDALFELLSKIPGVGPKSARCIMLYSFGRAVFPVDAHVGRVLARLGPFERLGVSLEEMDHKKRQAVLADLVPPDLRYALRVNLIAHGRATCRAVRPLCGQCPVRSLCRHPDPRMLTTGSDGLKD